MVIIANTTSTMCRTRALTTEAARPIRIGFPSLPLACRQGGRHTTGSAYFSLPVAFPSAILSTVALGENNCLTEFVKLIGYNRTAIALQSISREGGDCGARPIQWIAVGY